MLWLKFMVKWRYIFHRAQGFDFISNTKWWFSDFEKNAHQFLDHFPQAWKCNIKNTYFETTNCKEYQWGHGCNLRELSRSFIRSNATIQILDDFQSLKIQEFGANVICHPQHPFEVDPKKKVLNGVIYITVALLSPQLPSYYLVINLRTWCVCFINDPSIT